MIRIQIPPVRDGPTLKHNKKAIRNGEDDVEEHDQFDDPDVAAVGGDAEEEESDTCFQET